MAAWRNRIGWKRTCGGSCALSGVAGARGALESCDFVLGAIGSAVAGDFVSTTISFSDSGGVSSGSALSC